MKCGNKLFGNRHHPVLNAVTLLGIALLFFVSGRSHAEQSQTSDYRAAARLELAGAYYSQKHYGAALQEVKTALQISPKLVGAHNMLGLVHMALGQNDDAERAFRSALLIDANDAETHNNYGWYLCTLKDGVSAFTHFEKAAANPQYQTPEKALYNAGKCARQMGDMTKASTYFATALRHQPRATAVLFELADLQFISGRYQTVLDILERIDALQGPSPQALWLAIRAENKLGHSNEVESYGTKLLKKFPESLESTLYMAKTFD